jgi:hypothetical protein
VPGCAVCRSFLRFFSGSQCIYPTVRAALTRPAA